MREMSKEFQLWTTYLRMGIDASSTSNRDHMTPYSISYEV